jgi:hypothetical protein
VAELVPVISLDTHDGMHLATILGR